MHFTDSGPKSKKGKKDELKEIVLVGRSNVGKSTLFYQLFGKKVRKGKKPGTTLKPNIVQFRDLIVTDMPGFGYIKGDRRLNERIKDFFVEYIETNDRIIAAIQVLDAASFLEIVERWEKRNEIPIDIEMHEFLREFNIETFVAANKMDKVEDLDSLKKIAKKLGVSLDEIYPVSAKFGDVESLKNALKQYFKKIKRDDLISVLR
ncbi:GTP-binding protein EngB [Archaeoglobales archaeon]|nr:MAG: GTP-binding protein EngB [Archaeoglobales archaeon]